MAKIIISKDLTSRLQALESIKHDLLDEVIMPLASVGQVTMAQVIETDETANAKSPTEAKTKWDPIEGRRTVDQTMLKALDIHEDTNGVLVGWKNAPDYYEAQDKGWGILGGVDEPDGALYHIVHGAHYIKSGENAIKNVLPKVLRDFVRKMKK
jgi:hypothetical protein